jgi:hypothetical protein
MAGGRGLRDAHGAQAIVQRHEGDERRMSGPPFSAMDISLCPRDLHRSNVEGRFG